MRAIRANRHPAQLAMFAWTGYGGLVQFIYGPSTSSPTAELGTTNVWLNGVMVAAMVLGLMAAVLRDAWLAAGVELAAWVLMGSVYFTYVATLIQANNGSPTRTFAFILGSTVLTTTVWREIRIGWDAIQIRRGVIVVAPPPEIIANAAAVELADRLRDVAQDPRHQGDRNSDTEG